MAETETTETPKTETTTETPKTETVTTPAKEETVTKAEFDKVMAELHKHKKSAATLREEKEAEKLKTMKEQNQWKEIAEAKEREAAEHKTQAEKIQNSFLGERKFNALKDAASKLGLRPEAVSDLEMLDLDPITIETTNTGKINVLGADKFAERLKTLKPHWFGAKTVSGVNGATSQVLDSNAPITAKDIIAAEMAGRKSGDMSAYHATFKKFQQQRSSGR